MKKQILISIMVLAAVSFSFQPVTGQDKTPDKTQDKVLEKKDKDEKLKQAIELQKKQMLEQKKDQEEAEKALMEIQVEGYKTQDDVKAAAGELNYLRRVRPSFTGRDFADQNFYVTPGMDFSGNAFFIHEGDKERTTWDFSRYVKEATFSKQYSFDIEKGVGTVVMTVMGDCKAGEIKVKIVMPGGKTYSDIVIDESGNLNWRKSFTISDEENKDKAGEWTFKIDAAKATGSFKISLQTY